ncbi:UDP-N-acetylmuramoyl-tripeptide--D-alanyl-D-alanine ligase [Catenovulum adriaticum]|uniref:UDP-N-acetylmuramoyl-tripeptide--D-alanyl-D-alanine ligase n=1 Tax=Catenovulum adriaticum TaxID=2984846 RepID=A0ABY7AK73_9ALTE|nr:UDP-N-acetylmuramoyl-tripeptide--D-alanyl-D-alanine ligase [Catenovulum sp. TS8]WAJ69662.1 UDP-N-acetylmuramoyl-tripeptide--D-alanyl-D-alanine ligase [Catenovulum sp. TS8]
MIPVQLSKWAEITQGKLVGEDTQVQSVSHDSRQLENIDVYIAISGERFDGHQFCQQAVEQGVKCILVSEPQDLAVTQLVVKDTRIALGQIAAFNKSLAQVKTVAITGSCGKTTVKEMLSAICQRVGKTLATKGNYNNDIGVPLTLLRLTQNDEYAVIELGANHIGEIAYTAGLTQADVAVVNNVSAAHLEGFGSLEGVAQAKGEIYQALSEDGIAVINSDSEYLHFWHNETSQRHQISYSIEPFADVYLQNLSLNAALYPTFEWVYRGQSHQITLPLPGEHNALNALAAISCAIGLGISAEKINQGLLSVQSTNGRVKVYQPSPQVCIIDDTYNANLASMKAAINLLAKTHGHQIFIMGDMGEMGDYSHAIHQQVGEHVVANNIDTFYTTGELSQFAQPITEHHFNDINGLIEKIKQDVNLLITEQADSVITILVKGSRGAQMERVVDALKPYCEEIVSC